MNNKHIEILNKALATMNTPNIILYGHKDINKMNIIFEKIYPNIVLHDVKFKKINIKTNTIIHIFNLKEINGSNVEDLFQYLFELIKTKIYYSDKKNRILIFNNFNHIKKNIQYKLRVIIEKYRQSTLFILISDKYDSITEPIKSRCLSIRIPSISNIDKRKHIREIVPHKKYSELSKIFDESYKTHNLEYIKLYSIFDEGLKNGFINPYSIILDKIDTIANKRIIIEEDIQLIKDISYNIMKFNFINFYNELIILLLNNPKYTCFKKIKFVKLFSESEYNYLKSYKSIIHIESFIIKLIYLIR